MEKLLACMKFIGEDTIQRTQLTHRIPLVNTFQLTEGMRILEIGYGQGDTTVALADAVGACHLFTRWGLGKSIMQWNYMTNFHKLRNRFKHWRQVIII